MRLRRVAKDLLDCLDLDVTYARPVRDGGIVKTGKRDAQKLTRYSNGAVYQGGWVNNQRYGEGLLTRPDGYRYSGPWKKPQAQWLR